MVTGDNHERHEMTRKKQHRFRVVSCFSWLLFLRALLLLFCGIVARDSSVFAHPISLTESVVDVQSDRVNVELKVLVEDLVLYYPVSADERDVYPAEALRKASQSHREFVLAGLKLLNEQGDQLSGEIVEVDVSRISSQGVALTDIKQISVTYSLRFSTEEKPGFLTVSQTFGGEKAILPAMMDCQVKQLGVVLDVSQPLLSGQSLTTRFDWTKPPTPPKNWRELQQRRSERLKQQLGIASYSGLYSFFYITPQEVRHEILIPLLTLDEWISIKRADREFLDVPEQQAATKQVAEFFRKGNPVLINGVVVRPVVTRVNFFGLDIRDFAMNAEPRRVSVAQARVGIMLSYPSESRPTKVVATWETFNKYAPFLKSIVYEFDKAPVEHFFRPDERIFQWSSESASSEVGSLSDQIQLASVKSNGRRPAAADAKQISSALIKNVYQAFDFHGEKETYDALETAVEGSLLRTLYLQIRRSLLMAEQGGARSRVLDVKPVSGRFAGEPTATGFDMEYRWRVVGSVEHWGHIHTREHEYLATLSVQATGGQWKLHAVKFLSQKRVGFETRLRQ